ncbi:MAG: HNH endonuclease [bacterium]
MEHVRVLVLNQTFEPIHVCNARRAIRMMLVGKAESVEADGVMIRSERMRFRLPVVIRLRRYVKLPRYGEIPFSKKNIYRRDGYTCQYCSEMAGSLTMDHVVPRSRGGETTWENVVCCCRACNARKGNRLIREAGMRLIRTPRKPRHFHPEWLNPRLSGGIHLHWKKYLRPSLVS